MVKLSRIAGEEGIQGSKILFSSAHRVWYFSSGDPGFAIMRISEDAGSVGLWSLKYSRKRRFT